MFYHERSQPIDKKTQVDTYLEFTVWLFLRIMIKIYACRFCVIFITKIQTKPQILLKTSWFKHVNSSSESLWFKCIHDTWTALLSSSYLGCSIESRPSLCFYLTKIAQRPTLIWPTFIKRMCILHVFVSIGV